MDSPQDHIHTKLTLKYQLFVLKPFQEEKTWLERLERSIFTHLKHQAWSISEV